MGIKMGIAARSKQVMRHIALSGFAKGLSVLVSLLIVPLTINYVNSTQYGIWLTLSSVIAWAGVFDFGLGNGFRNRFSEAVAMGRRDLAAQYVSTTYFALSVVSVGIILSLLVINHFISWPDLLNIPDEYSEELRITFAVLSIFFSMNLVFSLFSTLLIADQRPGWASMITGVGQLFSLLMVYILVKTARPSLVNLAFSYTAIPCIFCLVVSIICYCSGRYREFRPRISNIRFSLIRDILSLGLEFFCISLSMLFVFQLINIMMTRYCGPESVTSYNVAYKYFNLIWVAILMIITPFWSSFTDAWSKKDISWMCSIMRKLELVWLASVAVGIAMLLLSKFFYHIWVGEAVVVPVQLSVAVLLYILATEIGNIYMYMINGIGSIQIQLIIYAVSAILSIPAMYFGWRFFGQLGIIAVPTLVYLIQAVFGRIQLNKLLNGNASGIWSK